MKKGWDGKAERRQDYQIFTTKEKEDIMGDLREIKHMLTGNGDPEKGIVFQVKEHNNFIKTWSRLMWIIATGAVGTPFAILASAFIKH